MAINGLYSITSKHAGTMAPFTACLTDQLDDKGFFLKFSPLLMTTRFNLLQAGSLVPPLAVCQISQTSLVMTDAISLMVRLSKHLDSWDRGQRQIMFMLTLCSPFDNIFATDFETAGWQLPNRFATDEQIFKSWLISSQSQDFFVSGSPSSTFSNIFHSWWRLTCAGTPITA